MCETKIGNKSEVKKVELSNFKNDYDGRKGQRSKKGQGEGKIIRDDKELTTAIIQSSIQGCPAEYRGEQKTSWQLNKLKQEAEKKGILEEGFFILKETADCFIAGTEAIVLFASNENNEIERVLKGLNPVRQLHPNESIIDFVDRIDLYNDYFSETSLQFEGVSEMNGEVILLFSQNYIDGKMLMPEAAPVYESFQQAKKRINEKSKLYKKVGSELKKRFNADLLPGEQTKYTDGRVIMNDLHLGNVMKGTDGKLYFIDVNFQYVETYKKLLR
jgi:hypothetical protein